MPWHFALPEALIVAGKTISMIAFWGSVFPGRNWTLKVVSAPRTGFRASNAACFVILPVMVF